MAAPPSVPAISLLGTEEVALSFALPSVSPVLDGVDADDILMVVVAEGNSRAPTDPNGPLDGTGAEPITSLCLRVPPGGRRQETIMTMTALQ